MPKPQRARRDQGDGAARGARGGDGAVKKDPSKEGASQRSFNVRQADCRSCGVALVRDAPIANALAASAIHRIKCHGGPILLPNCGGIKMRLAAVNKASDATNRTVHHIRVRDSD